MVVLQGLLTGCCQVEPEVLKVEQPNPIIEWLKAATSYDQTGIEDDVSQTERESDISSFVFGPTALNDDSNRKSGGLFLVPFLSLEDAKQATKTTDKAKSPGDPSQLSRLSARIPTHIHVGEADAIYNGADGDIFDPTEPLRYGQLDVISWDLAAASGQLYNLLEFHLQDVADVAVAERLVIFVECHPETCQVRYPNPMKRGIKSRDDIYSYPLALLAGGGCLSAVDVVYSAYPEAIGQRDRGLGLPLHYAAAAGHTKVVEYLLNAFPEGVRGTNVNESTPLHLACHTGTASSVELLAPAYPAAQHMADNKKGWTPQHYWVQNPAATGRLVRLVAPTLQLLTNRLETPLHLAAAATSNVDVLDALYKLDQDWIKHLDESLQTCLHRAVLGNQAGAVRWLLEKYPSASCKTDDQGRRPSQLVTSSTHADIEDVLLRAHFRFLNNRRREEPTIG